MKKTNFQRLTGLILSFLLILLSVPYTNPAASAEGEIMTFETTEDGQLPANWARDIGSSTANSAGVATVNGNKVLKMIASDTANSLFVTSPSFSYQKFTASYRVMFENVVPYQGLYAGTSQSVGLHVSNSTFRYRTGDATAVVLKTAEPNKWYDIVLIVDNEAFNVELWINGEFICTGSYFRNKIAADRLTFAVGSGNTVGSVMYIDDVQVSEGAIFSDPQVSIDLNSAQSNSPSTFYSTGIAAMNGSNLSSLDISSGLFGKGMDDRSLYIHNNAGTLNSGASSDPFVQLNFKAMMSVNSGQVEEGKSAVLSFNVAFNENLTNIAFPAKAYSEDSSGDGKLGYNLINISKDGKLAVWNQTYQISKAPFIQNAWHNIKLITYAGNNSGAAPNTYTLYFDDQLIAENMQFTLSTRGSTGVTARTQFRGFSELWVDHNFLSLKKTDGSYAAGGFYFDDFNFSVTSVNEAPVNMGLTHMNEKINNYINYPYSIYADSATNVSDILGINVQNGSIATVRDSSGNSVTTGSAAGKYLDLLNYECEHRYVPVINSGYSKDYDGKSITFAPNMGADDNWIIFNNTTGEGSFSAYGPVAGKQAGDESLAIVGGSTRINNSDTDFMNYVLQASTASKVAGCYEPLTLEYSVYMPDTDCTAHLQLYFDGAQSGAQAIGIADMKAGAMTASGVTAGYNTKGWNRIAVSVYPGTDLADIRLNGSLVTKKALPAFSCMNMLRLAVSGSPVGAVTAFDDFKIYGGAYNGGNSPSVSTNYNDLVLIDENSQKIIITADALDIENLSEYLTMDCDNYCLYKDSFMSAAEDTMISGGNMLVLRKGDIFRYYTIVVPPEFGSMSVMMNGCESDKFSKGTLSVLIPVNLYGKTMSAALALAQYDDMTGKLINLAYVSKQMTGNSGITANLNVTSQDGTHITVMLWEGSSMKPLLEKATLYPYSESAVENVVLMYPGYTTKAVTFSYDDGVPQDERLAGLLSQNGLKCTFNLVTARIDAANVPAMQQYYSGHEIANHTYNHTPLYLMEGQTATDSAGNVLTGVSLENAIDAINTGKSSLEGMFGTAVHGIAWPNGYPSARTDYAQLYQAVKENHSYTRWKENGSFDIPADWLEWSPTCHHKDAYLYTDKFINIKNGGDLKVYFIWGHAYEFDNAGTNDSLNWNMIEALARKLGAANDIWKAANYDICKYVNAVKQLKVEGNLLTNSTDCDVYVQLNGENVEIKAQSTYQYHLN